MWQAEGEQARQHSHSPLVAGASKHSRKVVRPARVEGHEKDVLLGRASALRPPMNHSNFTAHGKSHGKQMAFAQKGALICMIIWGTQHSEMRVDALVAAVLISTPTQTAKRI